MLSVLIPNYDYNAFGLVKNVHSQLLKEDISFEIICIDDGSKSYINKENQKINQLSNSVFFSLKKNVGRSAIRNLLSEKAKYNWLLFLDAGVLPVKSNFISNYTKLFNSENSVFCGGVKFKPLKENYNLLRYKYGKKHEEIPVVKRKNRPEKYFFTNNFLIRKSLFTIIKFEEKLVKYGREDLAFSLQLKRNNYKIIHTENEVYNLNLDSNAVFTDKTKNAMENLFFLKSHGCFKHDKQDIFKLIDVISFFRMVKILAKLYPFFEKIAISKSSVFFFNCLKISYLCSLKNYYEKKQLVLKKEKI